ncbi:MAG: hypothetical protein EAZ85_10035 [Bacteroidetes bacterium]|nr:MAG: hypothetical protein EAZ85_10035 [Bacteroidota bacterium]TAG86005.1 MAG: hypothetical protein EAZ20_13705 [Bacteroidota bacterium]
MKKKKKKLQPNISPLAYIKTKLKDLEMECFRSIKNEMDSGLVSIMVSRKMPSGKYCVAFYLLDTFCLGLKQTMYQFAITKDELEDFAEKIFASHEVGYVRISNEDAHNLIYGAIDYADELGFKPDKDFEITEFFLDQDLITDGIDDIEFGKGGMPFYCAGPYDNSSVIVDKLTRKLGKDNFNFLIPIDFSDSNFDFDFDDDDGYDDDYDEDEDYDEDDEDYDDEDDEDDEEVKK